MMMELCLPSDLIPDPMMEPFSLSCAHPCSGRLKAV